MDIWEDLKHIYLTGERIMQCDNCEYYDFENNECCYDPANPKKVTQPDAKCEYESEKD